MGLQSSTERPKARNPFAPPQEPLAAAGSRQRGARATRPWSRRTARAHRGVCSAVCRRRLVVAGAVQCVLCASVSKGYGMLCTRLPSLQRSGRRGRRPQHHSEPCNFAGLTACSKHKNSLGSSYNIWIYTLRAHTRSSHVRLPWFGVSDSEHCGAVKFVNGARVPVVLAPMHRECSSKVGTLHLDRSEMRIATPHGPQE
ncbi:uncharacterized protein LOC142814319 isoform X2 [Rhipicephalus microplus]|uniref:uncharacterized protein LOC142814319 isoform X2 n=1 Tax=Rhipicephalus microplus TaxID=6941 RepID=UPI003F6D1A10